MKLIKDDAFAAMQASINHYQAIVSAAREADATIAENAGAEELLSALLAGASNSDETASLQSQLEEKATELTNLQTENATLKAQIEALENKPATPVNGGLAPQQGEPTGVENDALETISHDFSEDPISMIAALKENGFI